jgi:hypothetical protein
VCKRHKIVKSRHIMLADYLRDVHLIGFIGFFCKLVALGNSSQQGIIAEVQTISHFCGIDAG